MLTVGIATSAPTQVEFMVPALILRPCMEVLRGLVRHTIAVYRVECWVWAGEAVVQPLWLGRPRRAEPDTTRYVACGWCVHS